MKYKLFAILLVICHTTANSFSQQILTDTSHIEFNGDSLLPFSISILQVTDNRKVTPCLVAYGSTKKFILIPVDKEICLNAPLSKALNESLKTTKQATGRMELIIEHFIIKKEKRRFSAYYVLETDITGIIENDSIGYLSYNYRYHPQSRRKSIEQISEELMKDWHLQFKLDLMNVHNHSQKNAVQVNDNFINQPYNRSHFFTAAGNGVIGLDFWQVDAELYFSRPETHSAQVFQGGILRYQNTPELEMIGFGGRSEHFQKRISQKTLFDINTNFLIGFNKWRNQENIKLQQVIQFSLSSSQSISLNPQNNPGWVLKVGLFENLYYIIEKTPKLQIGLYFGGGYKF